jgi:hypothetical protein
MKKSCEGFFLIEHLVSTRSIQPLVVSEAVRSNCDGHRCYGMMYGGVQWWTSVSLHRNFEFEGVGLQPNGRTPFLCCTVERCRSGPVCCRSIALCTSGQSSEIRATTKEKK